MQTYNWKFFGSSLALLSVMGCSNHCGTHKKAWSDLPPGHYLAGASRTEQCRRATDLSKHPVEIDYRLRVASTEITQRSFSQAMNYNPSFLANCPTCPVDSVTAHEAANYCNKQSKIEGLVTCYTCTGQNEEVICEPMTHPITSCSGYRLPTENEWEYAARAGARTPTYDGRIIDCMSQDTVADRIAWYKANSSGHSHPVGQHAANAWGLFDMAGNVYEWTEPETHGDHSPSKVFDDGRRALRGGSWYHNAHHLRAASRILVDAGEQLSYAGFRCVRTHTP